MSFSPAALQEKIDQKTKPPGSLGQLETLALQIGTLQESLSPQLRQPHVLVFAADHGIAATGLVNPYPQAVTAQMVQNFLAGGAAINAFTRLHQLGLTVVNMGVNAPKEQFEALSPARQDQQQNFPALLQYPVGNGTANYATAPAIQTTELAACFLAGQEIIAALHASGCNAVGLGEMGIGNSSSAALVLAALTGRPVAECVGMGTGASGDFLVQKTKTLEAAFAFHQLDQKAHQPEEILTCIGGFEIAAMTAAYLAAAEKKMLIVVDGFISTAAFMLAEKMAQSKGESLLPATVFSHQGEEKGHQWMLAHLGAKPLLQLGLRLGEGTGSALAFPLLQSALAFCNEMASFASAGVSKA
ncbi:MAG: nicotinate-nucleotide--dimethylbenzimidazole phosphoribosyltransferase [Sphingobacteriia bacterium]|nr:MAG: nicotinate-nucleotide--dimethylbenzimidazole phosphoribosyltransferase [Sphingobacteriia bacterium]